MKFAIGFAAMVVVMLWVYLQLEYEQGAVEQQGKALAVTGCMYGYGLALKDLEFTGVDSEKRLGTDRHTKAEAKCRVDMDKFFSKVGIK